MESTHKFMTTKEKLTLQENEPTLDTVPLRFANGLAKEHGNWVWDGLLYENDGIINPRLRILPNTAGARLRQILRKCYNVRKTE